MAIPADVEAYLSTLIRDAPSQFKREFEEFERTVEPTWPKLVEPFERFQYMFQRPTYKLEMVLSNADLEMDVVISDSPQLSSITEEVLQEIVSFKPRLYQSKPIYNAFKAIKKSAEWHALTDARKRIVDAQIKVAMLNGVSLENEEKERMNNIMRELSALTQKFGDNLLKATNKYERLITDKKEIEGLPGLVLDLAAEKAVSRGHENATAKYGPWIITLDAPSYKSVMQHAKNRMLREELYRAYLTRASSGDDDNTAIIEQILKLRLEKAKLLGYNNYMEVSMASKMATLDQAQKLLQTLRNAYWDLAVTDVQDLKDFCKHQGAPEANDFNHWDIMFWTERLRESKYELYEEQLREYFSLPMVLDGLFELANKLFGIHVKAADGSTPVWHKDVRCFSVWEGSSSSPDSTPIAHFYLDPYSRPSDKRGGSWMYPVVGRSRALPADCAGLPVAYILCNLMPPIGDKPCLMTLGDDEGLVAGMKGIEMDAIELPSQFMENWCYHRKTLMGMAKHYETGESLPKAIYKKLLAARNFCSGTRTLPQIEDAIVDLELHSKYIPDGSESIFYVHKRVCERTRVLPPFPDDKSLCGFQHIFNGGYEAGYYGYQWSKVLSADAFSAFEDVGLENEKEVQRLGRRFRETVLALGGGKHPLEIFIDFRGREPSMEPLLRHNGLLHYANHSVQSNPHTINCTYAISWRLVYISLMILFTLLVFIFMFYLGCNVTFHM